MKKLEEKVNEGANEGVSLRGLYFDGKRDLTITKERKGERFFRKDVVEEHICLVNEPGTEYIGHVTPKSGRSDDISSSIKDFLRGNFDVSTLEVIGCDGTVGNTGKRNGNMRQIEIFVNKPLQRVVCLLHFNELTLRHLAKHLDGPTQGPATTSGPIGIAILDCERKPVQEFEAIQEDWVASTVSRMRGVTDLSCDQQLLLDTCAAVSSGCCPPNIAEMKPRPVVQSRWLTTATRVLQLYMSESTPSTELRQLSEFIMRVYAPTWFAIKLAPTIAEGARHLWGVIEKSRDLPADLRRVVDDVIGHNAFFAHPENSLISMMCDEDPSVRELGWRQIKKARTKTSKEGMIRQFVVPLLRENATSYVDMIDWEATPITEPPLTRKILDQEITNNIKTRATFEEARHFLCHTQGVERLIRLVSVTVELILTSALAEKGNKLAAAKSALYPSESEDDSG